MRPGWMSRSLPVQLPRDNRSFFSHSSLVTRGPAGWGFLPKHDGRYLSYCMQLAEKFADHSCKRLYAQDKTQTQQPLEF